MSTQKTARIFTAVILLLPALAFGQGLTWESTTVMQMAADHPIKSTSYYLPRMFKQGTEKEATVFRLDKQMMYTINYEKKQYSEITFAEFEAFLKKSSSELEGRMAELKKQLADMPAEQRAAMEKMMGARLDQAGSEGKVEVVKSPGSKIISGFDCVNYVLKEDGKEIGSIWTTMKAPDFSAMQKDFKEFSERIAAQMTMKGPQMAEAMKQVEGFPIQTTIGPMTATVNSIVKAAVSPGEFEVPAGFKKVDFNPMEGRRGNGPPRGDGGDKKN